MTLPDPRRTPELRIGDAERHQVAEILREAAGEGRLDLDELDERLDAAYAAKTYADLVPLTLDLPLHGARPMPAPPPPAPHPYAPVPPGQPAEVSRQTHVVFMSGFERKGVWTVPGQMTVVAFMGGAEIDTRQARFVQRESTIMVSAVMGGVEIVVGPEVHVVMEVVGIMGGSSGPSDSGQAGPDSPILRVKGLALMGGVDVKRKRPPSMGKGGRLR